MTESVLILHTNVTRGGDDTEFNRWYNEVHVPDLLTVPGLVTATRYRANDLSVVPGVIYDQTYRYIVIYEVEADDAAALEKVRDDIVEMLTGGIDVGPDIDMTDIRGAFYTRLLGPVTAAETAHIPRSTPRSA